LGGGEVTYLIKDLEQSIDITDKEWRFIRSKFKPKSSKKGEIVHYAGDVFSEVWYIKSGLARSYFIDNNGKDFTWQLYFNDESMSKINLFMDDSVSHYEQSGSLVSFEVLEDAEFEVISMEDMDALFDMNMKWQHFGRMMIHDTWYASTYKRVLSLMGESAEERYVRLIKEYPTIFEKVKSYHIASYLGIAPQTLSKLRKSESK
jgi:CRP-like cAMP-binding protein